MKRIKPGILIILTVMFVVLAFLRAILYFRCLLPDKLGNFIMGVSSNIVLIPLLAIIIILSFFAPRRWAIIVWIVIGFLIAIALISVDALIPK